MSKENKKMVVRAYCRIGRAEEAPKKVRVVLYCRDSVGNEKSLEAQKAHLRTYAAEKGYEIVGEVCDTGSSISLKRKGVKEVYRLAHRKAMDKVITTELDRISKDSNLIGCFRGKLRKQHVEVEASDYIITPEMWKKVRQLRKTKLSNM